MFSVWGEHDSIDENRRTCAAGTCPAPRTEWAENHVLFSYRGTVVLAARIVGLVAAHGKSGRTIPHGPR